MPTITTRTKKSKSKKKKSSLATPRPRKSGEKKHISSSKKRAAVKKKRRDTSDALDTSDGLFGDIKEFITKYVVMPSSLATVVTAWIIAAWLAKEWDRFPHLAIHSPHKRCGKTLLLKIIKVLFDNAYLTPNGTSAGIYQLIEAEFPTILLDEAQSLKRGGSESTQVLQELFCSAIDRDAIVIRGTKGKTPDKPSIYCPKVFAGINTLDDVLSDRCLVISMKRKTKDDEADRFLSREVEAKGNELCERLREWVEAHSDEAYDIYAALEPIDIDNDRMAELLFPLQTVLGMLGEVDALDELETYAKSIEEDVAVSPEKRSDKERLLYDCREVFDNTPKAKFISTAQLIAALCSLDESPWSTYSKGEHITSHKLASELSGYDIKSGKNSDNTTRGYHRSSFEDAWTRYLSPKQASKVSKASEVSRRASR